MLLDVDQLNEEQRKMLIEYLQQEYEKNPDEFKMPKEKLEEILAQGGLIVSQEDEYHQDGLQEQLDEVEEEGEQEIEIEGGEQQIEDDGFPTEQEMID